MRAWWLVAALVASPAMAAETIGKIDASNSAFQVTREKLCSGAQACTDVQWDAYRHILNEYDAAASAGKSKIESTVAAETRSGFTDWYAAANVLESGRVVKGRQLVRASGKAESCWQDYCPCTGSGPLDKTLCRNLRGGLAVSKEQMAAGAAMRDASESLDEWKRNNPDH